MGNQCCAEKATPNQFSQLVEEPPPETEANLRPEPAPPAPLPAEPVVEEAQPEAVPEPVVEVQPVVEELKEEAPPGLPMIFDCQGEEKIVYVTRKPLGMRFDQILPITIKGFSMNSHGESVGVQVGWALKSFNGDDFTNLSTFQEATDILSKHTTPLPAQEPPPGIPLVFTTNAGVENTVYVSRKPLGLTFNKTLPIIISGFKANSHGEAVGVKVGWVLKSFNGEDLANLSKFQQVMDIMAKHTEALPVQEAPPGLPVVFTENGMENTVYVTRKPLGIVFGQNLPIKVSSFKANSHGAAIGIQVGWILKSFNGDDFTKLSTYDEASSIMKKHTASLPNDEKPAMEEQNMKASK